MAKIYVGIDPDLVKSGYARWNKDSRTLTTYLCTFLEVIEALKTERLVNFHEVEVIIEAGWLNAKANHHNRPGQTKAVGEAIARNVGENHAVGKLFAQVFDELGIKYRLAKPTTAKVSSQYFEKMTGLKVKNQEMIDAGMLVYGI